MFWTIFSFEIKNRVRRPVIYLYFSVVFLFTIISFATGSLPLGEKEHINSPYLIAMWCAGITMMMMLVGSSVMGEALYRDIEYNTKDYYLTYPITKAGYFWGRFLGSFVCMLFIATAILIGIYLGTKLGPAMDWRDAKDYGSNSLAFYLYPFITIALPNLVFTSSIFFGLIAITRNVKIIYSGGILLFLAYFLSNFFLRNTNNAALINLTDPFGLNGVRFASGAASYMEKNNSNLPVQGTFLINRVLWLGIGLLVLWYTYMRFNFEKFFSGKKDKAAIDELRSTGKRPIFNNANASFTGSYNRKTLITLTNLELRNIFRDNYFWIIISSGMFFLGMVFWMGNEQFGVPDFPRTVTLFDIFNEVFPFFIFFIIIFYTGETLHRDRATRYSFINDSLPPPNWVLNGSKLIALLVLGAGLSLLPIFIGLLVQTAKGFHQYNFPIYFTYLFIVILPRFLEMVLFCYMVHVVINNKFIAHAAGIVFWVLLFFLRGSGTFDYHLLLYSYTPGYRITDMDGLGHMMKPVNWFNAYWLLFGGLLIIIAALFYYRGVSGSFKERLQLVRERFDGKTKFAACVLLIAFLWVGAYNYYNVSYLNNYLMKTEREDRSVLYEKTLKRYQSLPLPKVTRIDMHTDLYPDLQQAHTHAMLYVVNKNTVPIEKLLLDADNTVYSLSQQGKPVPFTSPLLHHRGFFNLFRPKNDTAEFRLYQLEKPIAPGDSTVFEINSSIIHTGFSNNLYAADLLRNGSFFNGGLPGMGYDDDDELTNGHLRKKAGLPPRPEEDEIAQDDPEGISTLKAGKESDLMKMEMTISTNADQTIVAPGELQKQWQQNGRNYFYFTQTEPGLYQPFGIISAKFETLKDTVQLGHPVDIAINYHPAHKANIQRFKDASKDALHYFSSIYGPYPFKDLRLAETSGYGRRDATMTTSATFAEYYCWNADFTNPNQFDYVYFNATRAVAQQWWRYNTAPNNTVGSLVIPEGLANYSALVMAEKKYGPANIKGILQDQVRVYLWVRRRDNNEHPLIRANVWYEWSGKASVALFGLRDLIGEDSMNAALRDFRNEYAFRDRPPFAGARDLYRYLQKHTPDSLQYFLTDSWQKITLYDNKMTSVKSVPTGNKDEYKVTLEVEAKKVWIDDKGNDINAGNMNDYIDIGIFAEASNNKQGRRETRPLYLQKYKLKAGQQTITLLIKGKPFNAGIDPYAKLIDRQPDDNMKRF